MPDPYVARKNLDQYESLGFIGPVKAFDAAEMQGVADALLGELRKNRGALAARRNRHLDWDVAHRLANAPAVVDSAIDVLGPEPVLWRSNFFTIRTGGGLPWHQDEYRTLLSDPLLQISVHLAVTEATESNCVMVIPGSHRMTLEELADEGYHLIPGTDQGAYGAPNFWRDPARALNARRMLLRPGEFFLFHPRLMHASRDLNAPPDGPRPPPNSAIPPRVGFGLRITVPGNDVLPAAFAETLPRPDHCVTLGAR